MCQTSGYIPPPPKKEANRKGKKSPLAHRSLATQSQLDATTNSRLPAREHGTETNRILIDPKFTSSVAAGPMSSRPVPARPGRRRCFAAPLLPGPPSCTCTRLSPRPDVAERSFSPVSLSGLDPWVCGCRGTTVSPEFINNG